MLMDLTTETIPVTIRLNCCAMSRFFHPPHLLAVGLVSLGLLIIPPACAQESQGPEQHGKAITPDAPGLAHNHRLILKDGSYQIVRQYQVVGDRVRYLSLERGVWEELPNDLVDWAATRKWEQNHSGPYQGAEAASPGMKEAEELDKEEAAERAEQKARMPEVAKGLELPDQDGVFVLDTYQGTPELVQLAPSSLSMNQKNRHSISTM